MNQSPMPPMMPGASPMIGGMPSIPQWLIDIFRYGIGKRPPQQQQQQGGQMPMAADIPASFFDQMRDFPGLLQLLSQPRPNALPKDLRE